MLSFAHVAGYTSEKHEHKESICEICLSAKYQAYTSPEAAGEARVLRRAEHIPQPPAGFITVRDSCDAGITRGPPLSS